MNQSLIDAHLFLFPGRGWVTCNLPSTTSWTHSLSNEEGISKYGLQGSSTHQSPQIPQFSSKNTTSSPETAGWAPGVRMRVNQLINPHGWRHADVAYNSGSFLRKHHYHHHEWALELSVQRASIWSLAWSWVNFGGLVPPFLWGVGPISELEVMISDLYLSWYWVHFHGTLFTHGVLDGNSKELPRLEMKHMTLTHF